MSEQKKLEDYVRTIPDFPIKGIMFRDITTVVDDPVGFSLAIDEMDRLLEGVDYDVIAGVESRGFIFGAALAYKNKKGLALIRKKGKLPAETVSTSYALEYGTAEIEIHKDAIAPGQRVIVIDDLLATGGTAGAAAELVEKLGGKVAKILFLIELKGLNGRKKLEKYDIGSAIQYEGA